MIRRYYPAAADGLVIDDILAEAAPAECMRAWVAWENSDGSRRDVRQVATNYLGGYWLLPALNPRKETLSPLILWWLLIYAFSDLARCHAAEWTGVLDPNRSTEAVPIEKTLEIALSLIPRLILITLVPGAYPGG
jgi:hypothetical protein